MKTLPTVPGDNKAAHMRKAVLHTLLLSDARLCPGLHESPQLLSLLPAAALTAATRPGMRPLLPAGQRR